MKYSVNLVRKLRLKEMKAAREQFRTVIFCVTCFGALALACLYATLNVLSMSQVISSERQKLSRIEAEYRKYRKTRMIVDREDIELLNKLQNDRIFWTKKLAAMAFDLPENYWIDRFGFSKRKRFNVQGFGFISSKQEQLITLDDYLNALRVDPNFRDVFKVTYLNSTIRKDERGRDRVSFEYSSERRRTR